MLGRRGGLVAVGALAALTAYYYVFVQRSSPSTTKSIKFQSTPLNDPPPKNPKQNADDDAGIAKARANQRIGGGGGGGN